MLIGDVSMGKKNRGHYYRANEKFSGKGHHQHICKNCEKSI